MIARKIPVRRELFDRDDVKDGAMKGGVGDNEGAMKV